MVNGSDIEVCHRKCGTGILSSPRPGSPIQTSVIQSTKGFNSNKTSTKSTVKQKLFWWYCFVISGNSGRGYESHKLHTQRQLWLDHYSERGRSNGCG